MKKKENENWIYKNDSHLDHLLAEEIPCPYCLGYHKIFEVEWNYEDTFYAYMKCPEVGEVRVTFEFQDRFKRFEESEKQKEE